MDDQPLITDAWRDRVRKMVEKFAAEVAATGGTYYDRKCLEGWQRELERLEAGRVY